MTDEYQELPVGETQEQPAQEDPNKRRNQWIAIIAGIVFIILLLIAIGIASGAFAPEPVVTVVPGANITIQEPQDGQTVDITQPVLVRGEGGGLFEGNVVVQAFDSEGNIVAEVPTIIDAPDAGTGGQGPWQVQLQIEVEPGTSGRIYAFSPSPVDGNPMAEDIVSVTYGEEESMESRLSIAEPANGATVDISAPFNVSGTGAGLPEGNVNVQVLDQDGNVLTEATTVLDTDEPGGEGAWQVELGVAAEPGATGTLRAFSPDPASGDLVADVSIGVTFGESEEEEEKVELEDHLWLLEAIAGQPPIPGTVLFAEFEEGTIAGLAGCNNYTGGYERGDANLSVSELATTRKFCEEPEGVMDQEGNFLSLLQSARTFKVEDQRVKMADESGAEILVFQAAVVGTVTDGQGSELPEGLSATIKLEETDAAAVIISEITIENPAQFPIPFAVVYDPELIEENRTYSMNVRIEDAAGNLQFINTTAYQVITNGMPSVVEVVVEFVGE